MKEEKKKNNNIEKKRETVKDTIEENKDNTIENEKTDESKDDTIKNEKTDESKDDAIKNKKTDENKDVVEDNEEIKDENLLIDQKALEEKQLEAIKEVIKKNKKEKQNKVSKQTKYKKILKNILIALVEVIYFLILIIGKAVIPTIEYITCLKIFSLLGLVASIVILEISYKKDKEELFLHGIEMIVIASATVIYLHCFGLENSNITIVGTVITAIIIMYYLIKSLIIALKKDKKRK